MKKIVQGRFISIIVLLIGFVIVWPNIQKNGLAQALKSGGSSLAFGGQMALSAFPGIMGGGIPGLLGSDLLNPLGVGSSLSTPLLSSSMLNPLPTSAAYSLAGGGGGGLYLPGLSGTRFPIGGGSFMNFGNPMGLLGAGGIPLNIGGGTLFNNISPPLDLIQFSPSFNSPKTINSLFGFYTSPFNISRPGYYSGGSQNPFSQIGSFSYPYGMSSYGMSSYGMSPYGMSSYGMWGGMSQGSGYPYGGYPSLTGNYLSYTTPYTNPYTTSYSGGYYDRYGHSTVGTSTTGMFPYGFSSFQPILGIYGTSPTYSIVTGYISGKVTKSGGEPYIGATIIIRSLTSAYFSVPLLTNSPDGSYTLSVPYGSYSVALVDPVNGEILEEKQVEVRGPTQNINFSTTGVLKGVVKHSGTGIPLAGVTITAIEAQYIGDPEFPVALITSDSTGKYQLKLAEGDYRVTADFKVLSIHHVIDSVKVKSLETTVRDFVVYVPVLKGEVENNKGDGINQASVKITNIINDELIASATTNSKGEFSILLSENNYKVVITAENYKKKTINSLSIPSQGLTRTFELDEVDNKPPVMKKPSENEIKIEAGQLLSFSVNADDPDGDDGDLTYTIAVPAPWSTKLEDFEYSYQTTLSDVGEHTITITVSDDEDSTITNITVIVVYPMQVKLEQGHNLICYPEGANDSASHLLTILGGSDQVESILRYNPDQKKYQRVYYDENGVVIGDFPTDRLEGYRVYAKQSMTVNLEIHSGDLTSCHYNLHQGMNLIGIPVVLDEEFSAYDFLFELDKENVESIYRYNGKKGEYECAYWIGDKPVGNDFPMKMGEGYFIQMKNEKQLALPFALPSHYRLR